NCDNRVTANIPEITAVSLIYLISFYTTFVDNRRNFFTFSPIILAAFSISLRVFCLPILRRIVFLIFSSFIPIAVKTCDDFDEDELQADATETKTPDLLNANASTSPLTPLKYKLNVDGNVFSPFMFQSDKLNDNVFKNTSLNSLILFIFFSLFLKAVFAAMPRPTIPATFSVPALNPFS